MSGTEIDRLEIITRAAARELRQSVAAERLSLSLRQIQRPVHQYRKDGAYGLVSKHSGKVSNYRIDDEIRTEALAIIRTRYADFGPTLAAEKLCELHDIRVSRETVRKWMVEEGLWIPKNARERQVHQPRRMSRRAMDRLTIGLKVAVQNVPYLSSLTTQRAKSASFYSCKVSRHLTTLKRRKTI